MEKEREICLRHYDCTGGGKRRRVMGRATEKEMGDIISISKYIWIQGRKASADKLQATGRTLHLHTGSAPPSQNHPLDHQDYYSDHHLRRATLKLCITLAEVVVGVWSPAWEHPG